MFAFLLALMLLGCDSTNFNNQDFDSNGEPWPVFDPGPVPERVVEILLPSGFLRVDSVTEFGNWLRTITLKPEGTPVYLHDGSLKHNQNAHFRILDIDVGLKDLQQCADAVMRLRAEHLYAHEQYDQIAFNYTSGDRIEFSKWKSGFRPVVKGSHVGWQDCATCTDTYESFRKYMDNIFMFAGTASLSKELKKKDVSDISGGDVFIQGGFPGHAVIVMDVAENEAGERIFLLAQSYMPAQDIHILKNPNNHGISPWYSVKEIEESISTPEWTFDRQDLMTW